MSEGKRLRGKCKTTNWADYNAALKAGGSLTVWLDTDMQWYAPATSKRGRQPTFFNVAIPFCLSIGYLFRLALRQSLGMVESLLRLADLDWKVPDFSAVCRPGTTALDLLIDSTGKIRAIEITDNGTGNAPILPERLSQIHADQPVPPTRTPGSGGRGVNASGAGVITLASTFVQHGRKYQ